MAIHSNDDCATTVREGVHEWWRKLPVLAGPHFRLRGLRGDDASALLVQLNAPGVARFVSPPPSDLDDMKRFIRWSQRARRQKRNIVFGVVPVGQSKPVGIAQVWRVESDFSVAEWGFVLGGQYWGSGAFMESTQALLDFAFGTLGVHRLEARVAERNERAKAVLRKLGATREGTLRESHRTEDGYEDHGLWAILATDWSRRCALAHDVH